MDELIKEINWYWLGFFVWGILHLYMILKEDSTPMQSLHSFIGMQTFWILAKIEQTRREK